MAKHTELVYEFEDILPNMDFKNEKHLLMVNKNPYYIVWNLHLCSLFPITVFFNGLYLHWQFDKNVNLTWTGSICTQVLDFVKDNSLYKVQLE